MFKVNKKDTRTTLWRHSGVFINNFEHISHLLLAFLLLNLSRKIPTGCKERYNESGNKDTKEIYANQLTSIRFWFSDNFRGIEVINSLEFG